MNRPKKYQGFTLLESIIALAVFAFGILALGALQGHAMKYATDARFATQTSFLNNLTYGALWGLDLSQATGNSGELKIWAPDAMVTPDGDPGMAPAVSGPMKDAARAIAWQLKEELAGDETTRFLLLQCIDSANAADACTPPVDMAAGLDPTCGSSIVRVTLSWRARTSYGTTQQRTQSTCSGVHFQ